MYIYICIYICSDKNILVYIIIILKLALQHKPITDSFTAGDLNSVLHERINISRVVSVAYDEKN
jgi:hypothetical protein